MGSDDPQPRAAALTTTDLTVGYGSSVVVDGISFEIHAGQIVTLIGPNGAGKSTILRTIARQLAPVAGTVTLSGRDLRALDPNELARTMAILTTERVDPELMTCEDVVAMGRYPHTGRLGLLGNADRRAIADAMELASVESLADEPFSCVSDGQRQRVMLARAICQEPRVLVLDEPTSYLDIRHKLEFLRLIRLLARERGVTVLMSLHELELARHVSDLVACIAHGRIDRIGTAQEVFAGGYVRRLYEVDDEDFDAIYPGLDQSTSSPHADDEHSPTVTAQGASLSAAPNDHYVRSGQRLLRCGMTTGTCAALATAAATRLLLEGRAPEAVNLVTPKGLPVEAEVAFAELTDASASCGIHKDAGDDPDVTDGILVVATVARIAEGITIEGGAGVGRVTKPGLDQPVGAAAINRVPRQMIESQARSVADELSYRGGLAVTISVPDGEHIAHRTFNPQLGVVGGISILGTSGIEEPMSEQALVDTIELSLRQVHAQGAKSVLLLPGNYAEEFVRSSLPELHDVPQVKFANYLGEALDITASLGFERALVVGHIGKLVKLAGGVMNTHSRVADCRMELICAHAAVAGANTSLCDKLLEAATTDAALDLLDAAGLKEQVIDRLLDAMQRHLDHRVADSLVAGAVVFSNQHGLLGMTPTARDIMEHS